MDPIHNGNLNTYVWTRKRNIWVKDRKAYPVLEKNTGEKFCKMKWLLENYMSINPMS